MTTPREQLADFIVKVAERMRTHPSERHGQAALNVLREQNPGLANTIRGTAVDPFYNDKAVGTFYQLVGFELYKAETCENWDGVWIHKRENCTPPCPFHAPSSHHMSTWPIHIRLDRPDCLVERICEHGVGHPDPDSLAYIEARSGDKWHGVHSCEGCCAEPTDTAQDARENRVANNSKMVVDGAGVKRLRRGGTQ